MIFQDVHVSGHACQEEIKLIYSLVHPKYAIPVHGEYRHMKALRRILPRPWAFRRTTFSSFIPEMCWSWMRRKRKFPAMCPVVPFAWTVWVWAMWEISFSGTDSIWRRMVS